MAIRTRVEKVDLRSLKLLEVNARYMRHETFQRLIDNIRRDGCLTQKPFAVKQENGQYLVLSGNHRVMAALESRKTSSCSAMIHCLKRSRLRSN